MQSTITLQGKLASLRRLVRLAMVAVGLGRFLCIAAALVLLDFSVDKMLRLPRELRLTLLVLWGGALLYQFGRQLAAPFLRRLPAEALALEIEKRLPRSADLLASALHFARGHAGGTASDALRASVIEEAEGRASLIAPAALVRWRRVRDWLLAAAAAVLFTAGPAALQPAAADLWFQRNVLLSEAEWPRRTRLTLLQAPKYIPRGESLSIGVRAAGVIPRAARLQLRGLQSSTTRTMPMERADDIFFAVLSGLDESTSFSMQAGDASFEERRIEVVERPAVAQARMVVKPPAYIADKPVELVWNSPTFDVPKGSEATIQIEATKPLSSAECRIAGGRAQSADLEGARSVAFDLSVDRDLRCNIFLRDEHGIEGEPPFPIEIRAIKDQPPSVSVVASGISDMAVPDAQIPLTARATDDYGLVSAWLEAAYDGPAGHVEFPRAPLWEGPAQGEVAIEHTVDLRGMQLGPRGRFVVTVRATDNCTVGGPNTGAGATLSFRLVTLHELLAALLIRQQDLRRDLEQQIERQKEVRQRFAELVASGAARPGALDDSEAKERALARALALTGEQYGDVLAQMLNNRAVSRPVFDSRAAGIVEPLAALAAPGGAILSAVDAMQRAPSGSTAAAAAKDRMDSALADMEVVRTRMLLLENYAAIVTSVQEISEQERELLRRTEASGAAPATSAPPAGAAASARPGASEEGK